MPTQGEILDALRQARAIEELRKSLQLSPQLVEWSKQDTDLDSLRDDPAYQALYA